MDFDKDLEARQKARLLCRQAENAQKQLCRMSQQQLDDITEAIAKAFCDAAEELAVMAVEETGFGNVTDKIAKNRFASRTLTDAIRGMKTVGILQERREEKLWEVGVPVGVIAAIVPSTNPTSTICYKAIIALKAGNAIVFSPHPKARCLLPHRWQACRRNRRSEPWQVRRWPESAAPLWHSSAPDSLPWRGCSGNPQRLPAHLLPRQPEPQFSRREGNIPGPWGGGKIRWHYRLSGR